MMQENRCIYTWKIPINYSQNMILDSSIFMINEGNSFLRFHQKDYFGDNLLDIRPTILAVHQSKKQVKGFEEGKIVNGFRNVFPIYVGGEFQGSVELSNTFEGISTQLHKNYPFEYKLIIDKADVNSKLFPELDCKKLSSINTK
jgi:hypothetical protein